jgi:hypothetical protein
MHPARYNLAQAHLTRLRHQAQRAALARAGRRARPHQGGHLVPARGSPQTPREGSAMPLRDITRSLATSARRALRHVGVMRRNSGGSR